MTIFPTQDFQKTRRSYADDTTLVVTGKTREELRYYAEMSLNINGEKLELAIPKIEMVILHGAVGGNSAKYKSRFWATISKVKRR